MENGAHFLKTSCAAVIACLGAGLGNFPAVGHAGSPFQYDFGAEMRAPASQDPNRNETALAIYPITSTASGIASLADDGMSQQISFQRTVYGAAFGYDIRVGDSMGQLSFRQISEPIVPEPSAIFGGIAAAGMMLLFLTLRWRRKGTLGAMTQSR